MSNIKYYCLYSQCPLTDCEKHLKQPFDKTGEYINLKDYAPICERYIGWLVDKERGK